MSDKESKAAAAPADPKASDPTTNPPVVKVAEPPSLYKQNEEKIRGAIDEVLKAINPAIGEKNVARATKRLGNIARNVGIALGRLEKQTKRALRPKRVKKEKKPKTEGAAEAPAAPAPAAPAPAAK